MKAGTRWAILALLAGYAVAQAPTMPRLYTYYKTPTDAAWQWKAVTVDPPLTLTLDSAGNAHLCIRAYVTEVLTTPPWTLSAVPAPGAAVYAGGQLLAEGMDYTLSGSSITFTNATAGTPVQVRYMPQ